MKATIAAVDSTTRTWEGPKGTLAFVSGQFADGSGFSLGCKPENAPDRMSTLIELIGKEAEYELEAKPEYQGKAQWKLVSWPGKPAAQGGGGKREYVPRFRDTEEGFLREQRSIHRSVALQRAVESVTDKQNTLTVLDIAGAYFEWLSSLSPASPGTATSGEPKAAMAATSSPPTAAGDNRSGGGVDGTENGPAGARRSQQSRESQPADSAAPSPDNRSGGGPPAAGDVPVASSPEQQSVPAVHPEAGTDSGDGGMLRNGEGSAPSVPAPLPKNVPLTTSAPLLACQHETWIDVPNRPTILKCAKCGVGKKRAA